MAEIINVKDLVLTYADGTKAVQGISFSVNEGEFFGFLGPNGAGKSTTIKILTTLLHKTSGTASVLGFDVEKQAREIRKLIGVQSQESSVDPELTGRENMILEGHLQQMRGKELEERVDSLLEVVGLKDAANKRAGRYSGGMKKRLDLASVLVHKPKVLFLDEPTTGLDPQSRATVWDYMEELNKKEGITIFLTTQYLEEADRLCGRLCIVDVGKIVAQGSPAELKAEIGADAITITMKDAQGKSDDSVRAAGRQIVSTLPNVVNIVDSGDGLTIYAKDGGYFIPDLVRAFDKSNIKLVSINLSSPTLDDVFLRHTGKRIRVEELQKAVPTMFARGRGRR
ncbi:MAG TPA: ATP-binding cassette domain-containing protein [Nitrososphaerales archaeon]|nr:ATP-binding cassette domain-containing protein [Nitrososphaerales archaeon]